VPAIGVLLFLVALGAPGADASDRQIPMADHVQEIWDARDGGLPHPTVTALRQTRDQYLWVGTYSGLARFDGLVFHRPTVDAHAVYRDHVRTLAEAEDGALWVGTRRTGLVRIKEGEVRAFTMKEGLATNDILSVVTLGNTAWAAADALTSIDAAGRVRRYGAEDGLAIAYVTALFADKDGSLWIGGRNGALAWYDGRRFQSVSPWATVGEVPQVNAITRGPDGSLWVGTAAGLFQLEDERTAGATARGRADAPEGITSFVSDARGLWVGTTTGGLVRVEGDRGKRYGTADGLLHEWALAIHEGAQGSLWVGTRIGLVQLRPRIIQTYTQRDALPSAHAICVLASRNGDLWVGTSSGLARRRQDRWTTFKKHDGLPHSSVRALAEDRDGAIWLGTGNGVARYKDGRLSLLRGTEVGYAMRAMAADAAGRIWIGSNHGLDRLEDGALTRIVPREKLCEKSALNWIHPASDGAVWIGGDAALMRVRDGKVDCFVESVARLRNDVRYIGEEADGGGWIGSIGGLARIRAGKIEPLSGPRPPFNTPNYAVVDDGRGSLWCSTTMGLYQVRKEDLARDGGRARARAFGMSDGLPTTVMTGSGQPSGWMGPDGRLYFTTADGIAVVDLERVPAAGSSTAPVYVDGVIADGRPVALRGTPSLAPGTREVEIHFAAVNFIAPEVVRYRYRLEGLDTDWRDGANRRVAHYTNLRPGPYRFRVMATDHTDAWYEPGALLTFDLQPRFHQTLGFRALMAATLIGLAFGAHRLRLANARSRAAELQRRVNEAVASLQVLRGLLPICGRCRRVRQDTGYWQQLEAYVMERSDAKFSHSICKDCYDKLKAEDPNLPELNVL
jgi:ligand-binding sensor domain-containing protein